MTKPTSNSFIAFSLIFKKFVSHLMQDGKQSKTEKILKKIILKIALKQYSPIHVLILAINNVKPSIELRTLKIKKKSFIVPFSIHSTKQISLAIKTLLHFSQNKHNFIDFLTDELINSAKGKSQSVEQTVKQHRLAYQNRFFRYYR